MNRAPLSIIVPTLNAARSLQRMIPSLLPAVDNGLIRELIITDGGSKDNIETIADTIGATLIRAERGRGTQLHAAASVAKGCWLLFIHADTCLDDNWPQVVRYHMDNRLDAGYFRLRYSAVGLAPSWVARWANFRSKWFDLPYGDQGLLISRKLYEEIGGYPRVPIMEDLEIAKSLKGRISMLNCTATTDPSRYINEGWLKRGTKNLSCLIQYLFGASPETIQSRYENIDEP